MRQMIALGWVFAVGLPVVMAEPVKVASIEGVTEYRLANGARVLFFPRCRGRP